MLPLVGTLLAVAGLAYLAATKRERRTAGELRRLDSLAATPDQKLTREQADDGVVLARRFGRSQDESRFQRIFDRLRRT